MALDEAGVRFVVEGLSAYLNDIEKANDATEDVGTKTGTAATESGVSWGKIGKAAGLAAAAVATAVVAIGGTMLKLAGSFDDAYDAIQVKTGATGEVLDGLKDSFKTVFSSIPADGGDVAKALAAIAQRTGATGAPLETLTKQIVELSRITGTDLDANIESVLDATQRWGISADAAAPLLDHLFRVSQESGVPVSDLAQSLADNKAILDGLGLTLPESADLIGALGLAGIDADQAFGGLRIALTKMAKEGIEDPAAALQEYFQRIKDAPTDAQAAAIGADIFGKSALSLSQAIRDGTFDVDAFTAAVGENKNGILDTATQTDDWREKLTILKNKLLVEVEPALMAVFNAVSDGVEAAGPAMDQFKAWFVDEVVPRVKEAVAVFKRDWLPVIQRIGQTLQAFWDESGSKIFEQFTTAVLNLAEIFGAVAKTIGALIDGDWSAALEHFKEIWTAAFDFVRDMITGYYEVLLAVGTAAFTGIYDAADAVFGDLIRALSGWMNDNVIEPIKSFGSALYDAGDAVFGDLLRGMAEKVADFAELGWNIVQAVIDGLSNAWGQVLSWITDHLPTPSDLLPDWLGLGGIEITIPVTPILLTPSNWLEEWWQKELEKQDEQRAREEMQRIWEEWLKSHPIELSFDNLPIKPVIPKNVDEPSFENRPNKPFKPGGELSFDNQPGKPKMPGGSKDPSKPSLTDISDPARFLELVMNAIATIEALADADIAPVSKAKLNRLANGLRSIIVEFAAAMKGIRPEVAEAAAEIATFLDPILRAISEGAKALEQLAGDGAMPGYPRILQVITAIQYATATAISKLSSLDTSKLEKTAATAAFIADIMADIASAARDLGTLNNTTSGGGGIPGGGTTGGGGGNVDRLAEILAGFTSSIPRAGQRFEGAPGGVSYIVSATYVNPQTPGSIALDLQEIAMRASAA